MNPYDVLGVSPDVSDDELARAYKALARRYHPDLNPGDGAAARRMGEINRAYEDVKAMRRQGGFHAPDGGEDDWEAPAYTVYRTYKDYYQAPRRSPVAMILAAVVMFFLVRLLLSILFGGYDAMYRGGSWGMDGYGAPYPGYGYYEVIP